MTPYDIPFCLIMSHRGNNLINDKFHHKTMGNVTEDLLKLLDIYTIDFNKNSIVANINKLNQCFLKNKSSCLLFKESLRYTKISEKNSSAVKLNFSFESPSLSQIEAIRCITEYLKDTAYYLSTTGLCSRILYNINHTNTNFYMQGSMGCVSSIALGLSLNTNKKVVILDGDGAFLMKMGNVATIAHYGNSNLVHILFKNNMYASTGGQPLCSVNFGKVASASNYKSVHFTRGYDIEKILSTLENFKGPHFIEVLVREDPSEKLLPDIDINPQNITRNFMSNVSHSCSFKN